MKLIKDFILWVLSLFQFDSNHWAVYTDRVALMAGESLEVGDPIRILGDEDTKRIALLLRPRSIDPGIVDGFALNNAKLGETVIVTFGADDEN